MSETTSTTSSGTTTSNSRQQQLNSNRSSNQEATSSSAAVTADESSASSATLTAFEFLNEFINRNQPEEGGEMDDFHRFNNVTYCFHHFSIELLIIKIPSTIFFLSFFIYSCFSLLFLIMETLPWNSFVVVVFVVLFLYITYFSTFKLNFSVSIE